MAPTEHHRHMDSLELRTIIASSVDGFTLVNSSGDIVDVNDSYCQMVGYSREELLKMHISEIDAIESAEDVAGHSEEIIEKGSLRFQTRMRHKEGFVIDVEVTANYTPQNGGSFFSIVRDITERKQAENEMREAKHLYEALFNLCPEVITLTREKDGRYLATNSASERVTGYSIDELIGHTSTELGIWQGTAERRDAIKRLLEQGTAHNMEVSFRRRSGEEFPALISISRIEIGGEPCLISVVTDITEHKKDEKALQESKGLLAEIIELSPLSMAIVSMDGTIEKINRRAIETFGYSPEDIPNMERWWLQAYPDESYRTEVITQWMGLAGKAIAEKREIERSEYRVTCKDGTVKTALIFGIPVSDKVFVIFDDITERKSAEEERISLEKQLFQAQKLESLGVLAGGIAHDFNNLLMVIIGHCSVIKRYPATAIDSIEDIETAAQRAAALCQQMLAYAGKSNFTSSRIELGELVGEMLTLTGASIGKNVELRSKLDSGIPSITADASQIRQVTMNLIINAAESIGESKGQVFVSIAKIIVRADQQEKDYIGAVIPPGWYACLEVTDNGCGMDAETKLRIFEPFYTTKFTGRGLGMSSVLGIIKRHKGALQLFSQRGVGTTFKVLLPVEISEADGEKSPQKSVPVLWKGSGTILLVEDEEKVLSLVESMLEELGFSVIKALNGKEGLEMYQNNADRINLVVTDIGMPVMDGYELFRELKQLNPELPIIISSGFGDVDITSRIPIEDIAGLAEKPYNIDQLREVMKMVVNGDA